jgi:hypothetical protein
MNKILNQPKNTWYCFTCKFYVFNSKLNCNKCSSQKPIAKFTSYCPEFDKEICKFFNEQHLNAETDCLRCKQDGKVYNKDPLKSNHNCWKYQ